jgi:hypothetical protein
MFLRKYSVLLALSVAYSAFASTLTKVEVGAGCVSSLADRRFQSGPVEKKLKQFKIRRKPFVQGRRAESVDGDCRLSVTGVDG